MSDNLNRSYVGPALLGLALTGATGLCLYLLLRKEDDWEEEGQGGVTSRQVAIDVKIPKDSVGIVIGRQGSNIREIQAKTDTRINFKDELETEEFRVACIRGLPDDAQMAEILIHQTISQQPRVETLTMYVPGRAVGRIIGKGGENVREIQRVSRCKIDIERGALGEGVDKKIVLKGSSEQISMAKQLIEDKVKEEEMMRSSVGGRQPRIKHKQPLFLNYEQEDQGEETSLQGEQEELKPTGLDNCMEVFVSAISTPGAFWVQKIGPKSVDLDKLTQDMTEYYKEEVNQKLHSVTSVAPGDIIACRFSSEESFYRAKVVAFKEDSYDVTRSTVDLDFVDYGDFEEKFISEVYEIRTDFLKLKFQAIQCSMAHLKASPGPEWSAEACDQFEVLTHCAMWKVVWAKVTEYQSGGVPCVELIDTTQTGGDKNIGHELIKLGFASWLDKEDGSDQSDTATTLSRDN
eukprot:GFUD01012503.1.p1 GENE.GFUD01012503.1~~GFUD01012503.1.p1  ORF type:complete len:462 (+),score=178.84 GFUD01012503.1:110-1495(+)